MAPGLGLRSFGGGVEAEHEANLGSQGMNEENGRSTTPSSLDPFSRKFEYRLLFGSAVVCMLVGVVVTVLGASPLAVSVVKYVAPACAVLGTAAGARYGFLFNISNRCKGGTLLWALIGSILAATGSTLAIALMAVAVGTLAGFACGWLVGPLLTNKRPVVLPLIGAGVGAVIQAGWADPPAAARMAAWGGAVGAVTGPLFLAVCAALGYFVLRRTGPRSW